MSHLLGERAVDCLLHVALNRSSLDYAEWEARWDALCGKWGEKAVGAKLGELDRRGYIEYGVSVRMGWLTEKGLAKLAEVARAEQEGVPADRRGHGTDLRSDSASQP